MALATAANADLLSCSVDLSAVGNWTASGEIDAPAPPAKGERVTIEIRDKNGENPVPFVGTVVWSGKWQGRSRFELVGGAGGLRKNVLAKHYHAGDTPNPLALLVKELLEEAGETPVADLDTLLAPYTLGGWSRVAGKASADLTRLCEEVGLVWRVLPDGTVTVGPLDYAAVADHPFVVDPGDNATDRIITVAPAAATLRPGTTIEPDISSQPEYAIGPKRISRIIYAVTSGLRAELHYEE